MTDCDPGLMEIFCGQEKIRRPFNDRSNTLISRWQGGMTTNFGNQIIANRRIGRASLLHVSALQVKPGLLTRRTEIARWSDRRASSSDWNSHDYEPNRQLHYLTSPITVLQYPKFTSDYSVAVLTPRQCLRKVSKLTSAGACVRSSNRPRVGNVQPKGA